MARSIVMPSMGMYTEEGVLTAWLKAGGTRVAMGEPVAEITTEKATFEIPAPEDGTLHPIAAIGTTLKVEGLMGYILQEGEAIPRGTDLKAAAGGIPDNRRSAAIHVNAATPSPESRWLRASPIAKRLAAQHGIELAQLTGSGPGGRIVEADVQAAIAKPSSTEESITDRHIVERVPMAGLRRSLAERLRNSLSRAASTTLTREITAEVLVNARQKLAAQYGKTPSYDALFIKLFAAALRERPELNATIENDAIIRFQEINIGFAIAVPNGLVVPVVRKADSASFQHVADVVDELSSRVRAGRLQPDDLEGGTATISNLGSQSIDAFTPILNGTQSAILGIGRIAVRPVVRNAELAIGHTCVLSLTFDHRVADGAPAAGLLDSIARRMNDPQFFVF